MLHNNRLSLGPWVYVLAGAVAVGAAGTYQFVWSSIRPELGARLAVGEASLGTVFTFYIVAQTLSQFPAGWFRDRYGPRIPMLAGALLLAAGYAGTAVATSAGQAAVAYTLGGIGGGAVYTVCINTPIKWFTERRGLATGLVTMSFGGVSALFIPSIQSGLRTAYSATLLACAVATGVLTLLGAAIMRDPDTFADEPDQQAPSTTTKTTDGGSSSYGWRALIRTRQFWLLYVLLVVVNGVGLMLVSKAVSFAAQYGFPATVATVAASSVALADSAGVVTVGGLSDRVGRERTVVATVTASGLAIAVAVWAGTSGYAWVFVALLAIAAFFRSPVYSVIPALVGDYFGPERSSENYAVLYTAKVWGGIGGGLAASALINVVGWSVVLLFGAVTMCGAGAISTCLSPPQAR